LPVGRVAQDTPPHEIVEHDLARAGTEAEQARGLAEVQGQSWHLTIGSDDHRLEVLTLGLAGNGITPTESALRNLSSHVGSAVR
jgi:hypothetical protein